MTLGRKQLDLEDERTAQKRYRRKVQDRASRPITHQGSRNNFWTGTGLPHSPVMPFGALVGRVALRHPHEELLDGHGDFYIGESYADLDGVYVFSWAAPVACTFFRGSRHHELCDEVAVIRAFEHWGDDIVDFHDEPACDDVPAQPFRKRALTVPTAPSRPNTLRPPAAPRAAPLPPTPPSQTHSPAAKPTTPQKPAAPAPSAGSTPPVPHQHSSRPAVFSADTAAAPAPSPVRPASPAVRPEGAVRPEAPASRPAAQAGRPAAPPVRAEALLRARLAAPRTKSLAPVLATLQPDQYDLVTMPAMDSMIIEGQPGTGKTIVASHRAAYLVSDDTPEENSLDGDVLIVGPTSGYSRHVRTVIDRLTGGSERVRVLSLPELMRHLLDLWREPGGPISRSWQDVDKDLAMFVRAAVTRLKASGITPTPVNVYEHLRRIGSSGYPVTRDPEWAAYLRSLPPVRDARTMRAHTPLLATIQWEVAKPPDLVGIEHIIVDEART